MFWPLQQQCVEHLAQASPKPLVKCTLPRHLKLLVRPTDQRAMPCPLGPNVPDHRPFLAAAPGPVPIPPRIQLEAEAAHHVADPGAQRVAALADAAREDEGVDPALQRDVVRADKGGDAVGEEVEGEPLRGRLRRGDGGEVGRARQRLPAGLLVEDLLGARDVQRLGRAGRELADVACVVEDEAAGVGGTRRLAK
jgi:hypothetical protein